MTFFLLVEQVVFKLFSKRFYKCKVYLFFKVYFTSLVKDLFFFFYEDVIFYLLELKTLYSNLLYVVSWYVFYETINRHIFKSYFKPERRRQQPPP
jgi:DNA integrity scanning protein DisA with diadenylate cyclase activity